MVFHRSPRRTILPFAPRTVALACVIGLGSLSPAFAQGMNDDDAPEISLQAPPPAPSLDGSVIGKPVFSQDGQEVGTVRDVVMVDGRARVLNVGHGGFYGFGEKNAEIDVSRISAGSDAIVVQMSADQVASLPDVGEPVAAE